MSDYRKKQWPPSKGRGRSRAQPVADLVSKLLNPVIERRAGMTLDLIASWNEIAGEQHARHSRPEKLLWPRQASDDDPFEPATLLVACDGGHALFIQHDTTAIIERINGYFGFAAVARLKLVQKPLPQREERRKREEKPLPKADRANLDSLLSTVEDPQLRSALEKMGKGVFSKGSPSD